MVEVMFCSQDIFNDGTEDNLSSVFRINRECEKRTKKATKLDNVEFDNADDPISDCENKSLERSKRRARKAVYDYVGCNPDLDLFCTFTLDKEKIDRYDYNQIIRKVKYYLDNRVRRHGLKYVMVAEYHKDKAIHFHALINSAAVDMVDSGHCDSSGHKVYNLPSWKWGFTTAIKTYGERSGVCGYIVKYITKSDEKVGGRWYYHGGDLETPTYKYGTSPYYYKNGKTLLDIVHPDGFKGFTYNPDNVSFEFTIFRKG